MNNQTLSVSVTPTPFQLWSKIGLIALAVAVLFAGPVSAEEYKSGAGALEVFDGPARAAVPAVLKAWLMLLIGTFALSVVFVWKKPLARWALGGLVVAMFASGPIFKALAGQCLAVELLYRIWSVGLRCCFCCCGSDRF